MAVINKIEFILAGILLLLVLGCSATAQQPNQGVSSLYEPKSFDEVKPENVDLALVAAPNLPQFPDCSGQPRNVLVTLETNE